MNNKIDKAVELSERILKNFDSRVLVANLTLPSNDYDLLVEGVKEGWISERFTFGEILNLDGIAIERANLIS